MNSREKGKRGERQWRDELRAEGFEARRGQQFSGTPDTPDVICDGLPWAHFEVKLVERLDLYAAMDQARRDSGGRAPLVAHRRNYLPWLVTMDSGQFYRLLKQDLTGQWAEQMANGSPAAVFAGLPWAHGVVHESKRLGIYDAMAEARRRAGRRVVLLAHRRPGGQWLITMTGESFFNFLRGVLPPERGTTPRTTDHGTTDHRTSGRPPCPTARDFGKSSGVSPAVARETRAFPETEQTE